MANHKSALKRHRQSEKARQRNVAIKSTLKTAVKKVKDSLANGKADEARKDLKATISLLDGAVSKGALHRNNASRKIARLTRAVNAASGK